MKGRSWRRRLPVVTCVASLLVAPLVSAHAQDGNPVRKQGDVHSGVLPDATPVGDDEIRVAADALGERSRALIALDRAEIASTSSLQLLEVSTIVPRPEPAPLIRACVLTVDFEPGHGEGPPPEADCTDAPIGSRSAAGAWTFELEAFAAAPLGAVGVALVPGAPTIAPFTVDFDVAETAVVTPPDPPVDDTSISPPPPPDAPDAPTRPPTIPTIEVAAGPAASDGGAPDTVVTAPAGEPSATSVAPPAASGRPSFVALILAASAAGAVGLAIPPQVLAGAAHALRRRRQELLMNTAELVQLNKRFRVVVGVGATLAFALVAMVAADSEPSSLGQQVSASATAAPFGGGDAAAPEGTDASGRPTSPDPSAPGSGTDHGAAPGAAGNGATPGSATTTGPGVLTASDQGVSAEDIRIASIVIDPAFYARFGITDPETQRAYSAYAEELNASGGINGRRWQPVFVQIANPTDETAVAQACRQAFGDQQSFMMVNTSAYPGLAQCAAANGRILTDGGFGGVSAATGSLLDDLAGRYWIAGMRSERFVDLWAQFLAAEYGPSTMIGIVEHEDAALRAVSEQFQQALASRGFPRPSVFTSQADPSTAALQTNNAIARFRADGVQLIAPITNAFSLGLFQNAAEANGYRPEKGYTFSTVGGAANADFVRFLNARQMNGARGIALGRAPEDPEQQRCRDIYSRRAPGATFSQATADVCHIVFQNAEALRRSGTDLTVATWAAGYGSISTYEGTGYGTQSFSPTKRDGADEVQVVTYQDGAFAREGPFRSRF